MNLLKMSELIEPFTHQEIVDPSDVIAEIIDIKLENQMLFIVLFSPLRIHEYSFLINLEKDVSSIFMRHSEVFIAVNSWIQNINFMYFCFFGSYLTSLDFPFLYVKQSVSLKYFLTKWMGTCIPVLFPDIYAGVICCFSIRMLLNILSKCISNEV